MNGPAPDAIFLERIRYQTGQILSGSDLMADAGANAQLRWWHNRSLHDTYGVAFGLSVSRVDSRLRIQIGPGAAYDGFGRELLLQQARQTDLPTIAEGGAPFVLVLSGAGPRPHTTGAADAPLCGSTSDAAFEAVVAWTQDSAIGPADGLPLCVWDGVTVTPVRQTYRSRTNHVTRPHIGWGVTVKGGTPWEVWTPDPGQPVLESRRERALGLQTWIDTSAAGFTHDPCYFAWLATPLISPTAQLAQVLPTHLEGETGAGFWFRIWVPGVGFQGRLASSRGNLVDVANARASVGWIGLQEQPGNQALVAASLDPISFVEVG